MTDKEQPNGLQKGNDQETQKHREKSVEFDEEAREFDRERVRGGGGGGVRQPNEMEEEGE